MIRKENNLQQLNILPTISMRNDLFRKLGMALSSLISLVYGNQSIIVQIIMNILSKFFI
jgi:hypothetical protein